MDLGPFMYGQQETVGSIMIPVLPMAMSPASTPSVWVLPTNREDRPTMMKTVLQKWLPLSATTLIHSHLHIKAGLHITKL